MTDLEKRRAVALREMMGLHNVFSGLRAPESPYECAASVKGTEIMERINQLGKITAAEFGFGGYQDAMLGLTLSFAGKGWGVGHFIGQWGKDWSVLQARSIQQLLSECGVLHISQLVGKPVEVTFDGNVFEDFRILTEVL